MSKHDDLCEDAKRAIDNVHNDISVPLDTTLESLRDLREHIDVLIDAVRVSISAYNS
jgi:hypothetical protein